MVFDFPGGSLTVLNSYVNYAIEKDRKLSIHKTDIRVQWFDVDREDIVYYGNYFRFFSMAEDDFLRSLGITHNVLKNEFNIAFPRVTAECHYIRPALNEDLLEVHTSVNLENDRMLTFEFNVFRKEDQVLIAEGKVRVACVKLGSDIRLSGIPEEVLKKLRQATS